MRYIVSIIFLFFASVGLIAQTQVTETLAEFVGGEDALMRYIHSNLKYPTKLANVDLAGTIIFTFVVKADGSVDSIKLVKPLSAALEEEIVKMVRSMPRWKPATKNNKPVSSEVYFPIYICLVDE